MQKKVKDLDYYMNLKYEARIQKSDTGYFAEIPDLPGCMTFCEEFDRLEEMIEDAKKAWLEMSIEDNMEIPEPREDKDFSGKFLLRLPKSLHRKLSNQAERDGVSLNQHILNLLSAKSSALETMIKTRDAITDADESEKVKQYFSSWAFIFAAPISPVPLRDTVMKKFFPGVIDVKASSDTNKAATDYFPRAIQSLDDAEFSHHESYWKKILPFQYGSRKVATSSIHVKMKSKDSSSERKRIFLSFKQDRLLHTFSGGEKRG